MKFLITIAFFSIAFLALGQNQQGNSSKISNTEKKRLENEFKALGSFYIDDSGLVVYQNSSQGEQSNEDENETIKTQNSSITKNDNPKDEIPIVDQRKNSAPPTIKTKMTNTPNTSFYKKEIVEKEVETAPSENIEKTEIETSRKTNTQIVETKKKDIEPITKQKSVTEPKATQKKGSILNQHRESQYKSMEEAALAVEALLEELKKEEGQTTNSGSMSSKLSRGVNKNLRKKSDNSTSINNDKYSSQRSLSTVNSEDDNSNKFGVEPSYFINGVQVDKVEVSKLNKKDIIRREIRVRNTVTGNPNGEVWYEVK